jgi:hypothetical protein
MSRKPLAVLALLVATLSAACDSGPDGPGVLPATVTGAPNLGAAVLEVTGNGIEAFEGSGDTQAYSASLGGEPARHRVVLVSSVGGALHFGIRVVDRGSVAPVITVVSAADADNVPLPPGGLQVNVER